MQWLYGDVMGTWYFWSAPNQIQVLQSKQQQQQQQHDNNNNNNTITTATGEHENMLKWRGEHEKNCVSESGKLAEHIKEKPSKMNFSYTQHPFAVANGVCWGLELM